MTHADAEPREPPPLKACVWRYESDFDTRPRVREHTAGAAGLIQTLLDLPADGKSYARVEDAAGRILEVARADAQRLRLRLLKPEGALREAVEEAFAELLARFAAGDPW